MKLDPRLRAALESRGLAEPTPAQSAAWPPIASGKHTLLIAPTGVGKTEAAVVPLLDALLRKPPQPIAVLYITPLRSLNRDMLRRLKGFGEELELLVKEIMAGLVVIEMVFQVQAEAAVELVLLVEVEVVIVAELVEMVEIIIIELVQM